MEDVVLTLLLLVSGCCCASWNLSASGGVQVQAGEDAVLGCSFTHPHQEDYSGQVSVTWRFKEAASYPFLKCSFLNKSDGPGGPEDCSGPGLKHSLLGDPRRGVLSLLVREVQLQETGLYFCGVELEGKGNSRQEATVLNVTMKPRILQLEKLGSEAGASPQLRCLVEGFPVPNVRWLPGETPAPQVVEEGSNRRSSSIPYEEDGGVTCLAENSEGRAERRFPPAAMSTLTLSAGCAAVLLLLLLPLTLGLLLLHRRRRRQRRRLTAPVSAQAYENEAGNLRPPDGTVELEPMYSTISLPCTSTGSHQGRVVVPNVLYAPVGVRC